MLNSIAFFLFLRFTFNSFLLSRIAKRSSLEYLGFLSVLEEENRLKTRRILPLKLQKDLYP